MSTKVVCDRCGKDIVSGCNGLIWFNRDHVPLETSFSAEAGMDLCEECADELSDFMCGKTVLDKPKKLQPKTLQRWQTFTPEMQKLLLADADCTGHSCLCCPLDGDRCHDQYENWRWLHEEVYV